MALPGLPKKVNIPRTTTSLKSSVSGAIAVAERSTTVSSTRSQTTGIRYGVNAARTGRESIFNARAYHGPSLAMLRENLNANRTPTYFYTDNLVQPNQNSNNDAMNWTMAGIMGLKAVGELTAQITDIVRESKASSNSSTKGKNTFEGYDYNKFNLSSFTRLNELKGATSLHSINTIENTAKNDLDSFQENYSKDVATDKQALDGLLAGTIGTGLTEAGVTLDTSSLGVRNLNINPSDLASIDKAVETIDQDIADVDAFISTNLAQAITKLTTKSGELATQIGSLEAQIAAGKAKQPQDSNVSSLEAQLNKLKEEKQQVDAAKKALEQGGQVRTAVEDIKTTLTEKKNVLGDIQLTLSQVADKKYEVAKENDEELVDLVNKQIRLERKITALNGKIESETDQTKRERYERELGELKGELAGVYEDMIKLVQNLQTDDNQTTFTNSKGQTYTLKCTGYITEENSISTWESTLNSLRGNSPSS